MTLGASDRMDRTLAKLGLSVVVLLVIAMVSLACGSGGAWIRSARWCRPESTGLS